MAKNIQRAPLDSSKFWEEIKAMQLNPNNVQRALAHFALNHSVNDSIQIKDFSMFNPYSNYQDN